MRHHRIELEGPGATGIVVKAKLLRSVLDVVIEASQQAVRLRTQGRSRARGALPHWIDAATDFEVRITEGSTVLEVQAPTLLEVDPDQFAQGKLFPEIDPEYSSLDYMVDAVEAALSGDQRAELYDAGLLETVGRLGSVFGQGIATVTFVTESRSRGAVRLTPDALPHFRNLEATIPPPRQVKAAGYLDGIRHSDHTFSLRLRGEARALRGVAKEDHRRDLQEMWGKAALVSGLAYFTASGGIQRIEAKRIKAASDRDLQVWSMPEPVALVGSVARFRVEQGPRSGLGAILGRWPGDESDEEIAEALERMS